MEIPEKLLKFKYHFVVLVLFSVILVSVIHLSPRFLTILAYFWPLFLSTALFLAAVLVFGKTSSVQGTDASVDKVGEGLLDYVARLPEQPVESHGPSSAKCQQLQAEEKDKQERKAM
ncbi:putative Transmembrane protein [Quillaja saponaria]|uniref:Transmembrane protein n=1 Tax=Quillaja saponaria TaxID=32244 RepID=A0AAD7LML4_QUISA|nr:putative Transmembrane protein [Quillaja saponaria]